MGAAPGGVAGGWVGGAGLVRLDRQGCCGWRPEARAKSPEDGDVGTVAGTVCVGSKKVSDAYSYVRVGDVKTVSCAVS